MLHNKIGLSDAKACFVTICCAEAQIPRKPKKAAPVISSAPVHPPETATFNMKKFSKNDDSKLHTQDYSQFKRQHNTISPLLESYDGLLLNLSMLTYASGVHDGIFLYGINLPWTS